MENLKPFLYIAIALVWIIARAANKVQKKQIDQRKKPSQPQDGQETTKPIRPPARSMDEMLREILEGKKSRQAQTAEAKKQVQAAKATQLAKSTSKKTEKKKFYPESNQDPEFVPVPEVDHRTTMLNEVHSIKQEAPRKIYIAGKYLFDPKAAIIFSEIMKPKFED